MNFGLSRKKVQKFEILLIIIFLFSFVFSLILEYFFNFQPCKLCIIERYVTLVIAILLLFECKKMAVFFGVVGVGLGLFHKAIQLGIWQNCPSFIKPKNAAEMLLFIQKSMPCSVESSLFGIDFVWAFIVINSILLFTLSSINNRKSYFSK